MTLPSVLALAGCAALLVGLVGGGIEMKEIKVPPISLWTRILSGGMGLVLIGAALWVSFIDSPQHSVQVSPANTTTPISSTSPPTVAVKTHAPVLKSVVIREDDSKGRLILYQDVAYYDLGGDADYIDWILVSSTKAGEVLTDGQIHDSVEEQIRGSTFTGTWNCTGGTYRATVRVVVLDKAGNKSEPLEYNLNCR
jgi:hypothetical protein